MVKWKEKKKDVSEEGSQFQSGRKITRMIPSPEIFPYQKWQKSYRKLQPRSQLTEGQCDIKCVRGEELKAETEMYSVFAVVDMGSVLGTGLFSFNLLLNNVERWVPHFLMLLYYSDYLNERQFQPLKHLLKGFSNLVIKYQPNSMLITAMHYTRRKSSILLSVPNSHPELLLPRKKQNRENHSLKSSIHCSTVIKSHQFHSL